MTSSTNWKQSSTQELCYERVFSSRQDLFHCNLWFTINQYSIVIALIQFVITLKNSGIFEEMVPHKPLAQSFLSPDIIFLKGTDFFPLVLLQSEVLLVAFNS